jgi:hypothetical protein
MIDKIKNHIENIKNQTRTQEIKNDTGKICANPVKMESVIHAFKDLCSAMNTKLVEN